MAQVVLMPRQGNTVESCIIIGWRKAEGDRVKTGDILCEVETDKATFEVEAPCDGQILGILHPEGADVPVLQAIAWIGQAGEQLPQAGGTGNEAAAWGPAPAAPAGPEAKTPVAPQALPATAHHPGQSAVGVSPRARNLAASRGLDPASLAGSGPDGRIIERDVQAALEGRAPVSPGALQALKAADGSLEAPVRGSGIGGRVLAADLQAASSAVVPGAVAAATVPGVGAPVGPSPAGGSAPAAIVNPAWVGDSPLTGVRKLIAQRMRDSLHSTAQLTIHRDADARSLLSLRARFKSAPEALGLAGVSVNDLVLFAVSRALAANPVLNGTLEAGLIRRPASVNLGFAVDSPKGLMVPVLKDAQTLGLRQIAAKSRELAAACQAGNINPDHLAGASFTVSNLGALGITMFTPVLNAPQIGILGVCAIQTKPVELEGKIEFQPRLGLSLTIDHQAVDGWPAAVFLKELAGVIADLELYLI